MAYIGNCIVCGNKKALIVEPYNKHTCVICKQSDKQNTVNEDDKK